MARDLKFQTKKAEGLYYPCSENKDADQLRGFSEPDLRFCFRICKKPVFSRRGSNNLGVPKFGTFTVVLVSIDGQLTFHT